MIEVCGRCQRQTKAAGLSGVRLCDGCESVPATCVCQPVIAVPEWVRRAQLGQLPRKDYGAERAA